MQESYTDLEQDTTINNELIEENVVSLLLIVYLGHNVHHISIKKEIEYN